VAVADTAGAAVADTAGAAEAAVGIVVVVDTAAVVRTAALLDDSLLNCNGWVVSNNPLSLFPLSI
jgi:hypothetical protein